MQYRRQRFFQSGVLTKRIAASGDENGISSILVYLFVFQPSSCGEGKTLAITMLAETVIAITLATAATAVCLVILGAQMYMIITGKTSDKERPFAYPYFHGRLPLFL